MGQRIFAVVLAAGKGKRLQSDDLPKVMRPLAGKPMLAYALSTLRSLGIEKPIIVVGHLASQITSYFGESYQYVHQRRRLGTANAVLATKGLLESRRGITIILKGDQPFIRAGSIKRLIEAVNAGADMAILAVRSEQTKFDHFGRFLTDAAGRPKAIVEAKNASVRQLKIRLFNLGTYAIRNKLLWQLLKNVRKDKVSGEYYLTDIVALAAKAGRDIALVETNDETEAIGVNTPEQLSEAERVAAKRNTR